MDFGFSTEEKLYQPFSFFKKDLLQYLNNGYKLAFIGGMFDIIITYCLFN